MEFMNMYQSPSLTSSLLDDKWEDYGSFCRVMRDDGQKEGSFP